MAKKQETKKVEVEEPQVQREVVVETPPVVEQPKVETPVMETPKPKKDEPKSSNAEDNWEIKDRTYWLTRGRKPLSYMIKSAGIYWFDEEKVYEIEFKYC